MRVLPRLEVPFELHKSMVEDFLEARLLEC